MWYTSLTTRSFKMLSLGCTKSSFMVLEICWYIIVFEYSSELFCHCSDIVHNYWEFPLREATTAPSIEFSPDSTVASVWVTEGSGVLLDVWSSMGVSSMSVSFGWVLLINQSGYPFLERLQYKPYVIINISPEKGPYITKVGTIFWKYYMK